MFSNVSSGVCSLSEDAIRTALFTAPAEQKGCDRRSVAAIKERWPEHATFNNGRWGFQKIRRECQLAQRAIELPLRAPRLTPDTSCLPPLQLCRLLPSRECVPHTVGQRVRADVRPKQSRGRRAQAPVPGRMVLPVRITSLGLEF